MKLFRLKSESFLLCLVLTISLIFYLFVSLPYYSGDVKNHLVWANSILEDGPEGLYDRNFHDFAYPNYPPVAMLLFAFFQQLYKLTDQFVWFLNTLIPQFPSNWVYFVRWENVNITFLKLPAILANIFIGFGIYLFYKLLKPNAKFKEKITIVLLFLLNPASVYISAIWGQIDTLPLAFVLLAFYFAVRKKTLLAFFLSTLALLSKQTIIIFWIIFLIYCLKSMPIKSVIKGLVLTVVVFYLSYLPFHQPSLIWPINLYQTNFSLVSYSTGPSVINLWGILSDFKGVSDLDKFLGVSYHSLSIILFSIVFLPLLFVFIKRKVKNFELIHFLFLTTALYFLLLTRMHERYLIPIVVFSALAFYQRRIGTFNYLFFGILHFINLYRNLLQPDIPLLVFLADSVIVLQALTVIYFVTTFYNYLIFLKTRND